jgi:hypothetical protein
MFRNYLVRINPVTRIENLTGFELGHLLAIETTHLELRFVTNNSEVFPVVIILLRFASKLANFKIILIRLSAFQIRVRSQ